MCSRIELWCKICLWYHNGAVTIVQVTNGVVSIVLFFPICCKDPSLNDVKFAYKNPNTDTNMKV